MSSSRLPSAPPLVKNIVLVGRTGNGKSATGNSILGSEVFLSETKAAGVTMTCLACETKTLDGSVINVIDTPGLFDLSESAEYISKEIIKCLTLAEEGLHAVVLVLTVRTRITQEEKNTLSTLQVLFGNEIMDYLIVLFTGGDVLEENGKTIDDYFRQGCPAFLETILSMSGGRRVLFNNRTTDEGTKVRQVQLFLAHVASIEASNDGKPFRGQIHQDIRKEVERLKEQQNAVKATDLGVHELAEMKKQLQMSYNIRMSEMEKMVEDKLRETSAAQERMTRMFNENLQKAERHHEFLRNEQDQEAKRRQLIQAGVTGMMGICNML